MFSCILPGLSGVPLKLILKRHGRIISQNARQKHVGSSRDHGALTYKAQPRGTERLRRRRGAECANPRWLERMVRSRLSGRSMYHVTFDCLRPAVLTEKPVERRRQ